MTSGSYADHEGPDYLLARVRPNSVRLGFVDHIGFHGKAWILPLLFSSC